MFIVEGNIGVGKSTFLKIVQEDIDDLVVAQEPVDRWQQQVQGGSLLTHFYQNPTRWAYSFELATLMNRIQHYTQTSNQNSSRVIMERSLYSGYYCFAYNSYQQGFLNACEWNMYQEWFAFLVKKAGCIPRGFIYLRSNPVVAYERIKKRARAAEEGLDFDYVRQIHERHESFLINRQDIMFELKKLPLLIIECDQDFEHDAHRRYALVERVKNFMLSASCFSN